MRALASGFDRICKASQQGGYSQVDYPTFRGLFLADFPDLPESLSKRIFIVWDTNSNFGLDLPEVVCGICIMSRGKMEERLRLLFAIYDIGASGTLSKSILEKFACELDDCRSPEDERFLSQALIEEAFKSQSGNTLSEQEVGIAAFTQLVGKFTDAPLIKWINFVGQRLLNPLYDSNISQQSPRQLSTKKTNFASEDSDNGAAPVAGKYYLVRHQSSRSQLQEGALFKKNYAKPKPRSFELGDYWYVVSVAWFDLWRAYTGFSSSSNADISEEGIETLMSNPRPGPIDNRCLIKPEEIPCDYDLNHYDDKGKLYEMKSDVHFQHDYILLNRDSWKIIHDRYGGGPVIRRQVIEGNELELFPIGLNVRCITLASTDEHDIGFVFQNYLKKGPGETGKKIVVSKRTKVSELQQNVLSTCMDSPVRIRRRSSSITSCNASDDDQEVRVNDIYFTADRMRLWSVLGRSGIDEFLCNPGVHTPLNQTNHIQLLVNREETVEDANLVDGQTIVLEISSANGCWPFASQETIRSLRSRSSIPLNCTTNSKMLMLGGGAQSPVVQERAFAPQRTKVPATVGLCNLGNTCFMNSALQCLIHTPHFKDYFLHGGYAKDINESNKNGTGGLLADSFADLIRNVWTGNGDASLGWFAPRRFKKEIGRFDSRFNGFEQQDSQELLSSLLDGLAEDLNMIHQKAYVELQDSDGRSDEDVAREWWENHLRRELSIVSGIFTGQFKSLLSCETCEYESARFEPFLFLSLPLPEPPSRAINVTIVFSDAKRPPLLCSIRLPGNATLAQVRESLVHLQPASSGKIMVNGSLSTVVLRTQVTLDSDSLVFAHVLHKQIFSIIAEDSIISDMDHPIFAFEIPDILPKAHLEVPESEASNLRVGSRVVLRQEGEESLVGTVTEFRENHNLVGMRVEKSGTLLRKSASFKTVWSSAKKLSLIQDAESILLVVEQRQWHKYTCYFLNPYRATSIGLPLLLRTDPCLLTCKEVYYIIAEQLGMDISGESHDTVSEKEIIGIWGFKLVHGTRTGGSCNRCSWMKPCYGCPIPHDSTPLSLLPLTSGSAIILDWGLATSYRDVGIQVIDQDISIEENRLEDTREMPLSNLLENFSKAERLSTMDQVYCSHCKEFRDHSKKIDLWRLPPVMVIHLKRFQHVSTEKSKLINLVNFPIEGAEFESYLAPSMPSKPRKNSVSENHVKQQLDPAQEHQNEMVKNLMDSDYTGLKYYGGSDHGGMSTKYDLFGVVEHSGSLGAGHYVATVKNTIDSKWYLYDDKIVVPVEESRIVSSNAYMLFYIRQDVLANENLNSIFPAENVDISRIKQRLQETPQLSRSSDRCSIA